MSYIWTLVLYDRLGELRVQVTSNPNSTKWNIGTSCL